MTSSGPLQGIRIVDLTTVIMGPYATQILADYGADVIKVEPPEGDIMRGAAPMKGPKMGHLHLQMNRNKRGVVLDVKKEGGRRALLRLCEKADVFVHNVRPAALLCRERTGVGQEVELPMFETLAQFVLDDHMGGRTFDPPRGPPGYSRLLHRRPFETKDGYVCALVYNDKQWEAFFHAIGRPGDVAANPHLATYAERARNYEEAYASLATIFKTRTTREWLDLLEAIDIPCVRLNQLDALIDAPHLRAGGFFQEIDHPTEGGLRLTGIPGPGSEWRPSADRPPPRLAAR